MQKINNQWAHAAMIRMIRTIAQTMLGMITIGATLHEIDWLYVASVSIVAGIYSVLTSIVTTLPEVENEKPK